MENNNNNLPDDLNEEDLSYQEQVEREAEQIELEELGEEDLEDIDAHENFYDNDEDFDINVEE